jgi:DNA repair protein RadC
MKGAACLVFRDPGFVALANETELVADLVRPHFNDTGEWLTLFCFNGAGHLIAACENGGRGHGAVALTPTMTRGLLTGGKGGSLLVAHNHPSGELQPSADDITLTRQLVDFGALAGLAIIDHLICTRSGHFSFRAAGLL